MRCSPLGASSPGADPVVDKGDKLPEKAPAWLPGYRIRYPLRVVEDVVNNKSKSIFARLPGGGWLKADGSDVAIQTAAGQPVPVAVISHDPIGETLIQFPRNGNDRWYWAYVGNAAAAPAAGQRLPEGLTMEVRDWAGEDLATWPAVLAGLKKSERVISNSWLQISSTTPTDPAR